MKKPPLFILFLITLLMGLGSSFAGRGSIYVGPMASGEAVRILSTAYVLQPLTNACPDCIGIIVGPADLSNPSIVNRLQAAYEAGRAVALTNGTQAIIDRLHDLLEHRGSVQPVPGGAEVDLVAFRKAQRSDGQLNSSTHVLFPRAATSTTGVLTKKDKQRLKRVSKSLRRKLRRKLVKLRTIQRQRAADRADIKALNRIFSATAEVPQEPSLGAGPNPNIVQLAESYQSHAIQTDPFGDQIQIVNSVWAARSFLDSQDLYYVLQETDFHVNAYSPHSELGLNHWSNNTDGVSLAPNPTLIQPSPQTTMEATTITSSVSHTIGGSAGWNETQGLDASVSDSTTITNSKTTTIPPINITLNSNLATGETSWIYDVNELPQQTETITTYQGWIWEIPFSDYQSGQTEFQFSSLANMDFNYLFDSQSYTVTTSVTMSVPMPFGRTFALQPPVVTGVSPSSVEVGNPFTIHGTGLYPSLVQAVLIGGTQVSPANITTVSDTQISVIAPPPHVSNAPVAVQTAQGTSNTNFTITID